ncbi:MAG: ATP-binding protein [bacterium]|nr:ATP-binding protein [bacterium]
MEETRYDKLFRSITDNFFVEKLHLSKKKIKLVTLFIVTSIFVAIPLAVFGTLHVIADTDPIGYFELTVAILLLVNILLLSVMRNLELVTTNVMIMCAAMLIFILYSSGIEGTGIYWIFIMPCFAYFLKNRKYGTCWVVSFFIIILLAVILQVAGIIATEYYLTELRQAIASLLLVSIVVYFYERMKEEQDVLLDNQSKELQSEKDKIDAILQSVGDGLIFVNKDYKIVSINREALHIFHQDREEIIGQRYDVVFITTDETGKQRTHQLTEALKYAFTEGKIINISNTYLLLLNGIDIIPISLSVSAVKDDQDNIFGSVIAFRDLSSDMVIEKIKQEFISIASHQLRTPLTAIKLFTEMLIEEPNNNLNEAQREHLDDIEQSTHRMIRLVNDLLNVSRLESGTLKMNSELIDLQTIIVEAVDDLKMISRARGCSITFHEPIKKLEKISVDPQLIKQVVTNLLKNATQYSNKNCSIDIWIDLAKDNKYIICVKDAGIGIPAKDKERIFEKFYRADNANSVFPSGTGLGLHISKLILENFGGKIWFESVEHERTTFFVEIPISNSNTSSSGEKSWTH